MDYLETHVGSLENATALIVKINPAWKGLEVMLHMELPKTLRPQDYLNQVTSADAEYRQRIATSTGLQSPGVRKSTERLLVVVNDLHSRTQIGILLGVLGYSVSAARDVRAALEALSQHKSSLLILDLTMPDITAAGVLAVLRQEIPDVPIFAPREKSSREQLSALKAAGIDHSLIKTKDTRKLLFGIMEHVGRLLPERAESR